jgi:hypothetical protein
MKQLADAVQRGEHCPAQSSAFTDGIRDILKTDLYIIAFRTQLKANRPVPRKVGTKLPSLLTCRQSTSNLSFLGFSLG